LGLAYTKIIYCLIAWGAKKTAALTELKKLVKKHGSRLEKENSIQMRDLLNIKFSK